MFMLKKSLKLAVLVFAGIVFSLPLNTLNASEKEGILTDTGVEINSDISLYSKYIWRGFKLDDDPVIQPGVYVSGYGFDLSVWGSFDIDGDDGLNSDEVDYSIGYTYDFEKIPFFITGGFTYYDFPAADLSSKEFYVGGGFDVLLSPTFTWFHDFGDEDSGGGDGNYYLAEISHSFQLNKYFSDYPVSLDLGCHAGYNDGLFINGEGADVGISAGLTIALAKNCSLSPNIGYSIPLEDLKNADDGNQDEEFFGGATLAFTF